MALFLEEPSAPPSTPNTEQPVSAALRRKLALLRLFVVLAFAILSLQLLRLQLIEGSEHRAAAVSNTIRRQPLNPERGLIYDRAGKQLVKNVPVYSASIVPADLPEEDETGALERLASILDTRVSEMRFLVDQGRESKDPFAPVVLKDDIDEETALVIRELQSYMPGLRLGVQSVRHYIDAEHFSHIIGYMGPIDADEYTQLSDKGYHYNDRLGKTGVELIYEAMLRGRAGERRTENDADGRVIRTVDEDRALSGSSLVLSMDSRLQSGVAEIAQRKMDETGSASIVVGIMDVKNGELLSLVSLPEYDNNVFSYKPSQREIRALLEDPRKPLLDHAISEQFSPGSIFKQITGLAGLQEGVVTPATTYVSDGKLTVPNEFDSSIQYEFPDWRPGIGAISFTEAIAVSSDIYFYYVAGGHWPTGIVGLGVDRLAKYAREFGLGAPTGVDLPGEIAGLVPDSGWKQETLGEGWLLGDTYHFGIGQGYLSVTPLQMLVATAAVANDGYVLKPRVVREAINEDGEVVARFGREVRNELPIDKEYLADLREAMRYAVTWAYGTAVPAAIPNVEVAGKTGTAEFGTTECRDTACPTHGWFAGFAPYSDPEIAVITFVQKGGGNADAAPLARDVLDFYFNTYKNLPPEGETDPDATPTAEAAE